MIEFLIIFVSGFAALAAITVIVRLRAREAEGSGELRYRLRFHHNDYVIGRSEDPERFEIELKILELCRGSA